MDTFVDSAWYFLRYPNPRYEEGPFDPEMTRRWLPVDFYVGGSEHSVTHLIYARFITMCLHDMGYLEFDEPFVKLRHQGIITSKGAKISKSKGNIINPDTFIEKFGSDTFRIYLMFMGSYADGGDWDDSGITGVARFLGRAYRLLMKYADQRIVARDITYNAISNKDAELKYHLNHTIKKVGLDIESLDYNTAVAAMMELLNLLYKKSEAGQESGLFYYALNQYNLLLAPLAPHLAEELWAALKTDQSIFQHSWPKYDPTALKTRTITMVAQINGKLRGSFEVPTEIGKDEFLKLIKQDDKVSRYLEGKEIVKEVFIPGRLANIVVK